MLQLFDHVATKFIVVVTAEARKRIYSDQRADQGDYFAVFNLLEGSMYR